MCPNWVGDTVMATPAIRNIRYNFPYAKITLIGRKTVITLLKGFPYVDHMVGVDNGYFRNGFSFFFELSKEKFDLAFILPNSFSSALFACVLLIKMRVGYNRDGRRFLLTEKIEAKKEGSKYLPVSMVDYYLNICRNTGLLVKDDFVELHITDEERESAFVLMKQWEVDLGKPIILIAPGAAFGSSKCWKEEYFAQVCDWLVVKYGYQILLAPGPGEEPIAERIETLMSMKVINVSNPIIPIDLLKCVVEKSLMIITNDSGTRHIATALNRPAVVIMGPTDPSFTQYEQPKTKVLQRDVECSPCHLRVCPKEHQCMEMIMPDEVFFAVEDLVAQEVTVSERTGALN